MNSRRIRYSMAALGLGLGMAFVCGQAAAVPFFSPTTTFEDDDVDFHVDDGGGNGANADNGLIDVGERLKGVFEINTVFGSQAGQGPVDLEADTGEELTGVFDITVASKTAVGGGNFNFTFAPTGASGLLGAGGTMVRVWTDGTPDLSLFGPTNCTSQADCEVRAGLGDAGSAHFLDLGFGGDADENWAAVGLPDATAPVLAGDPGSLFGGFNHALSILANSTGQSFGQVSCGVMCSGAGDGLIDWLGSGTIGGGNNLGAGIVQDGAFGTSDFQATVNVAAAPEPGSLALLAVGLLGLGVSFRMRSARYNG